MNIFKTNNSTQVEKLLTLLKEYDVTSSAKLINKTDMDHHYNIHPNDRKSMRTLLKKSYPNAIINNNLLHIYILLQRMIYLR